MAIPQSELDIVQAYTNAYRNYSRAEKAIEEAFLPAVYRAIESRNFDIAISLLAKVPHDSQAAQFGIVAIKRAGHNLMPSTIPWSTNRTAEQKALVENFERARDIANKSIEETTGFFRQIVHEAINAGNPDEAYRRAMRAPAGVPFAVAQGIARTARENARRTDSHKDPEDPIDDPSDPSDAPSF